MEGRKHPETATPEIARPARIQPLREERKLFLGIDIGSISSDIVVMDQSLKLLYSDYQRTKGKPFETALNQLYKVLDHFKISSIVLAAATGTSGRFLATLLEIPFINEVPAQAAAICKLYPELNHATVIEMGGQDSKLISLASENRKKTIHDFALNTGCAAGTGSFLDQQADRLGIKIENEFGLLALQSKNVPRMAGRCSVFAKSDMIHLQQQATPNCDIIAGLCQALASNLKSNLGRGKQFVKPVIFTGGVAANVGVVKAIKKVFELRDDEFIVPEQHFFTGAIGAVIVAKNKAGKNHPPTINLQKLQIYLTKRGSSLQSAPRLEPLAKPILPPPASTVHSSLLAQTAEPIDAYLGLDVGSISTNVVIMDKQKRVLSKAYLMTAGQPLEAVRKGLDIVAKHVSSKVKILGAATTGSGRYLTGDFVGADLVINEITAQAAGAAIVNPSVDTIFEIGGQDSKYISLENGVVVDFEMNHACAAGTGSFLEEQSQRLGISIKDQFADLALKSKAPIKLGERCTVFMESDLLSYQQQGADTPDLVAGLSYSIVTNYLNRVVGRRKTGNNICFQGGTAFNKAVWSAFEKITKKPIMVPDHHEVTGALGAASIVAEFMDNKADENGSLLASKFRGFENLITVDYSVVPFSCEHCPNHCEIKKVQISDSEPLYYGSRCDRYNIKKKTSQALRPQFFDYRNQKLNEFAAVDEQSSQASRGDIGIPISLIFWQFLPLFMRFFKELGFKVLLSEPTNKKLIRKGLETATAQTCFPVKVAYGHIAELIERKPDYIFLPSIVSMTALYPENEHNQLCPYVQSIPFQANSAFNEKLGSTKILTTPIRMGEGRKLLYRSFIELGKKLTLSSSKVRKALDKALSAQDGFETALREKGKQILQDLGPEEKLFVLVSRPYNGCDDGVNLELPKKLADLGIKIIPMDMLDLSQAQLSDKLLHQSTYWTYGQKILRAAEIIRRNKRLFAIYLSNFSCGPDSFIMTFFKEVMGRKPCLQLEIDEHSADAGVITRLEAFLESLKNYKPVEAKPKKVIPEHASALKLTPKRTLYIPYMSDCTYAMAACFRAHGQPSLVMDKANEKSLLHGRRFTTGKECLPCAITAGDMLNVISSDDCEPEKVAFFMPSASGPCRFGMYNCLHRLILNYMGAENVPVFAPNQDTDFYETIANNVDHSSGFEFIKKVWTAMIGVDLMHKLIMRLRPFAQDPEMAQQVYDNDLKKWIQAVENNLDVSQAADIMESIAKDFESITIDHLLQKPMIGIVGEIYVRNHPFANRDIIKRLENLGAACDLASLAEWVYYTNFTRTQMSKRRGQIKNTFKNILQNSIQYRIEKKLATPLEKRFGKIAEEPVEHVINLAKPYIHHSFEGEAILTVGKTIEYHQRGFGGVINVMPFTCMPSTVVNTQTTRLSADCGNMPILNLSFDGQENPALTTHLEAFVEQVRQREGMLSAAQLLAIGS
ncbi:MAG: acyl-CoA dehydratase activase [Planctomycetota bacterium]|jgi:predicted CoA-substrate-specific enzyme activase